MAGRRAGVGGEVRRLVAVARLQGRDGNGQLITGVCRLQGKVTFKDDRVDVNDICL